MRENWSCSKMEVLAPKVMSLPLLMHNFIEQTGNVKVTLRPPHKQEERKMPQAMSTARSTDLRLAGDRWEHRLQSHNTHLDQL